MKNLAIMVAVAPSCWNHSNSLSGLLKSLPSFGYRKTRGMGSVPIAVYCNFSSFFSQKKVWSHYTKINNHTTLLLQGQSSWELFSDQFLNVIVYCTGHMKMCLIRQNHNVFLVNFLKHVLTQCCMHFATSSFQLLNQRNDVGMQF